MKYIKTLALLMIVALATSSCDLLNVDVDTTMSGVLDIQVEEAMAKAAVPGHHFSAAKILDPQDDKEVEKYAANIVDVGVGNITAEVVSVSKDDVLVLKGAVVTVSDDSNTSSWVLPEDWLIEVGNEFMLDDQGSFYDEVSAILKDVEEFTIIMEGYSSVSNVSIGLKFNIDATVTGSVF